MFVLSLKKRHNFPKILSIEFHIFKKQNSFLNKHKSRHVSLNTQPVNPIGCLDDDQINPQIHCYLHAILDLIGSIVLLETIYRHTAVVDDQLVNFEIMDTAGQVSENIVIKIRMKHLRIAQL